MPRTLLPSFSFVFFLLLTFALLFLTPNKTLAFSGIDANGFLCQGSDSNCGNPPPNHVCSDGFWTCQGNEPANNNESCDLRQSCDVPPLGVSCGGNPSVCGTTISCDTAGAHATCSVSRSGNPSCMDCATPAWYKCVNNECVSDGGDGTGEWPSSAQCDCAPQPTVAPTAPPVRYRCDGTNFTCAQDPNGNYPDFSTCSANCTNPSCGTACGSYTDTWTCPGGAPMTCNTFATSAGTCGTPCNTTCSGCPASTPTPPPGGPTYFCSGGQCRERLPGGDSTPTSDSNCNGGAGCGGGACTLGNGATGCNDGSGRCCLSGLRCNGSNPGTCSGAVNTGPCTMPHTLLLYPAAPTSANSDAVVIPYSDLQYPRNPFHWRSDQAPGAACTWAHDGLDAEIYIDDHLIQHLEPPGYGFDGTDPNTYVFFPNPAGFGAGESRVCANGKCGSFLTYANPVDPSMVNTSDTSYSLPFTPAPGVVHTWFVVYHSPNGREGGAVRADNWTHGRFIVMGPPAPPQLACQTITPGDTYPDVCDVSQGSPTGYGNLSRGNLTARDMGPAGSRQASYSHRYNITDVTNPATPIALPPLVGPNNGANNLFSIDARPYLLNGHRYSWNVITTDNAFPPDPTPDSLPSATWTFLYDTALPQVSSSLTDPCFDNDGGTPTPTIPNPMVITAVDPGTPTNASNIRQVTATAVDETTGQVVRPSTDITSSCTWSGGGTGLGTGSCNFDTSWAQPNDHIYVVLAQATDNAGNVGTSNVRFTYRAVCIGPWLQSTHGDVHSNDRVNTPGGPD
jgi:hypothetical protein